MIQILFLLSLSLVVQSASAVCKSTMQIYKTDADNIGVVLPLQLTCSSASSSLCVYNNQESVGVEGDIQHQAISSESFYRQNLNRVLNSDFYSLESGNSIESISQYQELQLVINNSTLTASVRYSVKSSNPFVRPTAISLTDKLTCVRH